MNILKPEEAKEEFYFPALSDMTESEKSIFYASLFDKSYDTPVSESTFDNIVNEFTNDGLTTEQAISKAFFAARMQGGPYSSEKLIGIKPAYFKNKKVTALLFFNKKRLDLLPSSIIRELINFLEITLKNRNE